jgi:hypothetical protein
MLDEMSYRSFFGLIVLAGTVYFFICAIRYHWVVRRGTFVPDTACNDPSLCAYP